MRIPRLDLILCGLLIVTAFTNKGFCGAFDDAEEWGGYWRRSEPHFGHEYYVPPTLYYGHAPQPEYRPRAPINGEAPLYSRIPPTSTGQYVEPYHPLNYGRGRYFGPSIDPYYAPGRASYGGYHYGWW